MNHTDCAVILVAAGRGRRSGDGIPKQYRPLAGASALRRNLALLTGPCGLTQIQVVIHPDDRELYDDDVRGFALPSPVSGGETRQASVLAGLVALERQNPAHVLIHDAARPFASPALIARAIEAARFTGAAIPALRITDTVKSVSADGRITGTADRDALRFVQTPQAFAFATLIAAHRKAEQAGRSDFTDDAALMEWAGHPVSTFEGETSNIKLTTPEDFMRAETMLRNRLTDIRTGMGFDVHEFEPGDHVTLGGVRIAHDQRLSGHSDADVVLHAAVDAILGALADGDIGAHFPPSDPQWKGATSDRFLKFAAERVAKRGGVIAHLDITVVSEAPKIGPHRDAMRARIAEIAGITPDRVGVKATTNEGMGFIGRREGMVAYATATIRLPEE
ncbi:bifunctional 2-C-methyl-D-erythritol 4-phosphate cytidylyltransferase/2-C-methyl-D-erythritol 2,4-cyclodiphosphate synthase [Pseudorhodoplanes sp.]|uniref:bifunctional 2-C-methyl-D-erythritol 4-phosphate cytidylyltransferase/2-C-methyl-D-erythritol 2,4-cyclodiphosphate synthase n=1 Tax=Pseudorhodoplanes sp. TaxID=1934341 RepID=UPI002CD4469E|nr:bifunctional 2-C-methyl-D-erythritol 4-phosphate cytidylyltransferase/2-C-methyl-D-erythritol 2,4-cyclodiphosphate synthase [Pseudorhodoplanes sp.]HWV55220.1 bifunctional 2-C-methyl-D-erythritol 4-phosphate cytidylyltransferase/2-C-methyl-D-erythritol 2,4-cyclodiphosphate synthase [Pseudorhodoplanes sp.]